MGRPDFLAIGHLHWATLVGLLGGLIAYGEGRRERFPVRARACALLFAALVTALLLVWWYDHTRMRVEINDLEAVRDGLVAQNDVAAVYAEARTADLQRLLRAVTQLETMPLVDDASRERVARDLTDIRREVMVSFARDHPILRKLERRLQQLETTLSALETSAPK